MKYLLTVLVLFTLTACQDEEKQYDSMAYCQQHYRAESYKVALEECTKAAQKGQVAANWLLGHIFEYGLGGKNADLNKAFAHYQIAAEKGFTPALAKAGEMAFYGEGTEPNYDLAYQWLAKAASNDNVSAQFTLGILFMEGKGRPRDMGLSVRWLRQAASQDHPMSMNNLAWLYATSEGKPWFNPAQARRWYDRLSKFNRKEPMFIDTGASVAAAEGEYEKAVSLQKQAIALLPEDTDAETLSQYQSHLDSYLAGQRWVEKSEQ